MLSPNSQNGMDKISRGQSNLELIFDLQINVVHKFLLSYNYLLRRTVTVNAKENGINDWPTKKFQKCSGTRFCFCILGNDPLHLNPSLCLFFLTHSKVGNAIR